MKPEIPAFLIEQQNIKVNTRKKGVPPSYLDRAIHSLSKFILASYMEWETASREGLFQKIDSRIKLFFLIYLIVIVSLLKTLTGEIFLGIMVLVLGIFSRLPLFQFYKKILVTGGIFGFLIPLPSALNLFSPGELLLPLFSLPKFLIPYTSSFPEQIGITNEGLSGVLMIACRVINSLSITLLVFYTTPFPELMRGLLLFRIPVGMVMVITLTYKYLFLFVKMILEIFLARKARYTGGEKSSMMRSWVAGRIVFLFQRSQKRFEELYRAMVSRGFTGTLKAPSPRPLDIRNLLTGISILLLGILILII